MFGMAIFLDLKQNYKNMYNFGNKQLLNLPNLAVESQ